MKNRFPIAIALMCAWAASVAMADEPTTAPTSPTTQPAPATQPVGGVIRGHISIAGASPLQHLDLSHVVVYLGEDAKLMDRPGPATRPTVAQYKKAFTPNFLIISRNTEVDFPNWDHFDHNVFSRSAAAPAFDLDRYPYGQSKTRTFDKLGVVQIFCNIHPQMRAIIYVTPDNYFARADAQGNYQIDGVPVGTYQLFAWQERCDEQQQPVSISLDQPTSIDFTLTQSHDSTVAAADNSHAAYGVERGLGVKREQLDLPVVTDVHAAPENSHP
jgi:plastocyanin